MLSTSLQIVKFILIAGGLKTIPDYLKYLACHLYRQCPCQGLGQKGTVINLMKRNGNHGESENITPGLLGCSCQDFLQTVKPVGAGFNQNNPGAYPPMNFQL
jgi:hypothetical protein